jgi:hypothetical protein
MFGQTKRDFAYPTLHAPILYSFMCDSLKLRGFSPPANYTDRATAACCEVSVNFSG